MRFTVKTAILSLLAVLALGAPAASASLPEFSGPSEKLPAAFKGTVGENASFEVSGVGQYNFANNKLSGERTGTKTLGNVNMTFNEGGVACLFEKEPSFPSLTGRLGYINKAKKEVGMIFEPTKEPIGSCSLFGVRYQYVGQFIAKITPIGPEVKTFTLTFRQARSSQEPEFLEGEKESFPKRFPLKLAQSWSCFPPGEETFCEMGGAKKVGLKWTAFIELPVAKQIIA